jgi:hypothetical protein
VHGSYNLQRCDSITSYENFHLASFYKFEKQGHPKFEHQSMKLTINDALPSPGVNPLEGSPKCNCGKRDSEGAPGFQL